MPTKTNIKNWKEKVFDFNYDKKKIATMLKDFIDVEIIIESNMDYVIRYARILQIGCLNDYVKYQYYDEDKWKTSVMPMTEMYLHNKLLEIFE